MISWPLFTELRSRRLWPGWVAYLRARQASARATVGGGRPLLPYNFTSPLTTYFYSACPLGIIANGGELSGAVLNYHIQLFFPASKLTDQGQGNHVRFLPGLGVFQFEELGYLALSDWKPERILARRADEVVHDLVDRLAHGRYVLAYVDRFFLRHTRYFLRRHSRYAIVLIGVDDRLRSFVCAAYVRGVFSPVSVPFHVLVESLQLEKYGIAKAGMTTTVQEIQRVNTPTARINPELIRRQLSEYLQGINNLDQYRRGGDFALSNTVGIEIPDARGAVGTGIYPLFQEYLKRVITDDWPIDLRATRTLMEHKMMIRLALDGTAFARTDRGDAGGFARAEQLAREFHFAAFAFHRDRREETAQRMNGLLTELIAEENRALSVLLEYW